MSVENLTAAIVCPQCQTQVARTLLVCPVCHRLTHAQELNELAERAAKAEQAHDIAGELELWREALQWLPEGSRQYSSVVKKISDLSARVETVGSGNAPSQKKRWSKVPLGLGAVALLLWKFKVVVLFVVTKAKLLLLGLTKTSTLFSMLLSLGVYWTAWGWKFALGLVVSIYVHEMGHVAMLRRYGIKATAPMFIPGVGAFVRLKQYPTNVREDARIGLAGPVWGLSAALIAWGVSLLMNWPSWAAIARVGAWINLFNLLPIWQLDGGRAFHALNRGQKWFIAVVVGGLWFLTSEGLLLLILLGVIFRAITSKPGEESDRGIFVQYIALAVILSVMCRIPVSI
jgi:Zn-dependent protease